MKNGKTNYSLINPPIPKPYQYKFFTIKPRINIQLLWKKNTDPIINKPSVFDSSEVWCDFTLFKDIIWAGTTFAITCFAPVLPLLPEIVEVEALDNN